MIYPREYVEKVRREFAGLSDIVEAAEAGQYRLGVLLARSATMRLCPEEIVASLDSGDHESVREDAARSIRRRALHAEWMRIVIQSLIPPAESPSSVRRSLRPSYHLSLASAHQ